MPELAEVQTVRDILKKQILDRKIKDIKIIYDKIIENPVSFFKDNLINESFIDIKRKGKYLIFETNNHYLISHLRMEGKYFIKDTFEPIEKHEHIIFCFDEFTLRYHDTRKFGRMILIPKDNIDAYFKKIGPDAIEDINEHYLFEKIKNSQKPIKTLLLDQSIVAGLGNIYADEVLYESKINPLVPGKNIDIGKCKDILTASKKILLKAIEHKGTTIRSYTSSLNVKGNYQVFLNVHTKKVCKCKSSIKCIKIGGRSSYYCPKCQGEYD